MGFTCIEERVAGLGAFAVHRQAKALHYEKKSALKMSA
jgi:hypothetical protein